MSGLQSQTRLDKQLEEAGLTTAIVDEAVRVYEHSIKRADSVISQTKFVHQVRVHLDGIQKR
jgi:hypothetical protein